MPSLPSQAADLQDVTDVLSDVRHHLTRPSVIQTFAARPGMTTGTAAHYVLERLLTLRFLEARRSGAPAHVARLTEEEAPWDPLRWPTPSCT